MTIAEAIKNLYKKITGGDIADKSENQIAALIQELADNWPASGGSETPKADAVEPVSAENAGTIGAEFAQEEVQKIATLADALKTTVNEIITNLKSAGLMS